MKQRLYIKHHPKTFFLFGSDDDDTKWSMPKERLKGSPQTLSSIDQFGSDDDDTMVLLRLIGRKAEKAIKREMMVRKILRNIWRRNCNIFRNHMNKKKRLFVSKQKWFKWLSKELILKRKGFVLNLLKRMKE